MTTKEEGGAMQPGVDDRCGVHQQRLEETRILP